MYKANGYGKYNSAAGKTAVTPQSLFLLFPFLKSPLPLRALFYLYGSCLAAALTATLPCLRILEITDWDMPIAVMMDINEDPPLEMKSSGTPVSGIKPLTPPDRKSVV